MPPQQQQQQQQQQHNHKQFGFAIVICLIYLCTIIDGQRGGGGRAISGCGFKCLYSNECVAEDQECDGSVDCQDGTDETSSCERLKCPKYAFKCNYGACIRSTLLCDGKEDCADGSDENNTRCQTFNNNCRNFRTNQFQCNSGSECISLSFVCDGVSDCSDHSDENYATCARRACRSVTAFRCDYGGCIDGTLQCNGVNDCRDGSDEDPRICRLSTTTQTPSTIRPNNANLNKCRLPSHPDNGRWILSGNTGNPGDFVDNRTSLYVSCNEHFQLHGAAFVTCQDGAWNAPLGYCEVMCPPLDYNQTVAINCSVDNETISCSKPINQTIAVILCNPINNNVTSVCQNGVWVPILPICGQFTVNFLINVNIYARNKNWSSSAIDNN